MREKTQVLIVGAGRVGQALAIELGHRGIDCLVLEKNPRRLAMLSIWARTTLTPSRTFAAMPS